MGTNALTFENLLQVDVILKKITYQLTIEDFLSFENASKFIHSRCVKLNIENLKYEKYFQKWGIPLVKTTEIIDEHTISKSLNEINIFQEVTEIPYPYMKQYYMVFHRIFTPYLDKLSKNQINANFFVSNSNLPGNEDPINQALILNNVFKYNSINANDPIYYQKIKSRYEILKDIFVNSVLKELDNPSTSLDTKRKFISVLLSLQEYNICIDYFKSLSDFQTDVLQDVHLFDEDSGELDIISCSGFWTKITQWVNKNIELCDTLFQDDYPVIIGFCEEIINESWLKFINEQFSDSRVQHIDKFFNDLQKEFINNLVESKNAGGADKLQEMITQFVILYFEPFITNFTSYIVNFFHEEVDRKLTEFNEKVESFELKQNEQLYETIHKQYEQKRLEREEYLDDKNKFLRSFQQLLKINNNKLDKLEKQNLEVEYSLNKMTKTLENINSLIDLNLCMEIISLAKLEITRILSFKNLKNFKNEIIIEKNCEMIFKILIKELETKHVSPAFVKTITVLREYNEIRSFETESSSTIEPLVKFTELINIGDVIIQLVTMFYKNEILEKSIIQKRQNNDFLNEVIFMKKQFETNIDDFVAEGLNVGINKLMDEVEYLFNSLQLPTDYNPLEYSSNQNNSSKFKPWSMNSRNDRGGDDDDDEGSNADSSSSSAMGYNRNKPDVYAMRDVVPSECCLKVIELIKNHCFLLNGITDRGTIEVYQQEIGERFFQCIVKNLKKNLISKKGAIYLICDINYYYNFISEELKLRKIVPLFESLKFIAQLYLVDGNGKELGKMICDPSRYNGIFTQEEVYEFVTRRCDWYKIKNQVDKTIYGLDCVIQ